MNQRQLIRTATVLFICILAVGCEDRLFPTVANVGPNLRQELIGTFTVRTVDDSALPHVTTNFGTVYSLDSARLEMHADSTWLYHSLTVVLTRDSVVIGTQPLNATGNWVVVGDTLDLEDSRYGKLLIRGDTLFWDGPRYQWEPTLRYALTK
jgi:hypothetical protein